ncbi:LytR/AlgR family response regulator transcription factor [Kangiella koreensis]|uniref:Two component transcriptional regulator, LytTR family n=1 Tax=Kangiella koreensis (strain DSM 16069 / JCM 12317 / KCTC 12182 / SW-125) TaxID=523791 RepID=C7R6S4_KANKD|nr:LytTR family DNA-binding domain-containing protein [Kangiella koreensis]ACV25590.1 two component transcriptional regulator, LytTR family [Kangiella koreensis DSM 16069]
MISVLIVDDEQPARQRLRRLLDSHSDLEIVGEAENGQQALDLINSLQPDLIFLDISMPVMNGMQVAKQLNQNDPQPHIIFTTAYDEYALQAFDVDAQDYLLKPIRHERLSKALQKLQRQLTQTKTAYLSIRERETVRRVAVEEILFLHSDQKYTEVHLAKEVLLSSESLKDLEQRFSHDFIRIHRSTLVNRQHLIGIEQDDSGCLALIQDAKTKPEISRRHQPDVRQFLTANSA